MYLQFTKIIQFSLLVKAGDRLREFNFRKLKSPAEQEAFTVNVCDERGERILFNMEKQDKEWKLSTGRYPQWIIQTENRLHEAIEQELKNW